jgi:hypothetical protein
MRRPRSVIAVVPPWLRSGRGRFEPAKPAQVLNACRLQRQNHFRQIEPPDFRQFLQRPLCMLGLRPQSQAPSRRRPPGPPGSLIGARLAYPFDKERVDPPVRVIAWDSGEAAVDHKPDAFDRDRRFRDIGGDDNLRLIVSRYRRVLVARREFAVQREEQVTPGLFSAPERFDRLMDFVAARHENKHVPGGLGPGAAHVFGESFGRKLPYRRRFRAGPFGKVIDRDRKGASLGSQNGARLKVFFEESDVQRGGHYENEQIGAGLFLNVQRAGERDVAVKMPLVEFVENHGLNSGQRGILDQLAQQDAFRLELDARRIAGDVFETNLITDFAPEWNARLVRHARREQSRRETPRLESDHASAPQQSVAEKHPRNLRGLTGTGGRLKDKPFRRSERGDDLVLDFVDR